MRYVGGSGVRGWLAKRASRCARGVFVADFGSDGDPGADGGTPSLLGCEGFHSNARQNP